MQLLGTSGEVVVDRISGYEHEYLQYFVHFTNQVGTAFDPKRHWNASEVVDDIRAEVSQKGGPLPFRALSVDITDLQRRALRKLWEAFSEVAAASAEGPVRYYAEKWRLELDPLIDAGIKVVPIDLVRDPRDVFASIRAFNQARGFLAFGRRQDQSEEEYLWTRIEQWQRLLKELHRPVRGIEPICVRYEDMVDDLRGVASRVGAQLGLSLDAARVEADRGRYRKHMTSDGATGSVGRWRQDLSSSEIHTIESELGSEMARFGYTV